MNVHFSDSYLLNPAHPLSVAVIGAGGTGSQVMQGLARIDYALYQLGHPGLYVELYDADVVTEANIGRQLFAQNDVGLFKSDVLATRINSFFGTDWDSIPEMFPTNDQTAHNITITCVDSAKARIEIGRFLRSMKCGRDDQHPFYWLDMGNQVDRGQVVLGSIGNIKQPKKSKDHTVPRLKCVDEVFDLALVDEKESGPSCSLAEALSKQDLFINSAVAQFGCNLLWKLITAGSISLHGAFINLSTYQVNPMKL